MTTLLEDEHRALITEPLDEISQRTGDSSYQVFSDWVDLALVSFAGDEDAYQKPLTRYDNNGGEEDTVRELAKLHANALGGLVLAMEQTEEDVLGGVYEYYGLTSSQFAQYFTPGAVSRAMAAMNLPDSDELRDATSEDPLVIGDISGCGSGRLIVNRLGVKPRGFPWVSRTLPRDHRPDSLERRRGSRSGRPRPPMPAVAPS